MGEFAFLQQHSGEHDVTVIWQPTVVSSAIHDDSVKLGPGVRFALSVNSFHCLQNKIGLKL